jgi:hypothetical protein
MVEPMTTHLTHHRRLVAWPGRGVWMAAALFAFGSVARGEDDRAVDDISPAAQQMQEQQQANRIDLGANFDANVFQQSGNGFSLTHGRRRPSPTGGDEDQVPESPTLAAARKLGSARLAQIDSVCSLAEAQRRKLRLAMESDIRRLAEEIDVERRKYQGVEVNFNDQAGQRQWQQFQQDVQRCRQRLQALFDSDSLFAKVLPTTLDAEQYGRLTAESAARRTYRWKALVATAMLKFDDLLGLDQRQHEEIEKFLLEREPALRIDRPANRQDLHAQQMLVSMVLSEVDGKQLQGIVSERQWKTLSQLANQGKAMRSYIEAQGLLEKVAK